MRSIGKKGLANLVGAKPNVDEILQKLQDLQKLLKNEKDAIGSHPVQQAKVQQTFIKYPFSFKRSGNHRLDMKYRFYW